MLDFNIVFLKLHFDVFGDYLHLTRQHWISSLSLILPGNDDDRHLQDMAEKERILLLAEVCLRNRPWISDRSSSQDPSYPTVLDCTTVVLTLSGNDVFWVTPWSPLFKRIMARSFYVQLYLKNLFFNCFWLSKKSKESARENLYVRLTRLLRKNRCNRFESYPGLLGENN